MRCEPCGEINESSNRFCKGCGGTLQLTCRACGATTAPGSRFCGACGEKRGGQAPGPDSMAPGQIAEGEVKHVTVLFSDLVRSTELIAGLDAEAAMERLQPLQRLMREAVEHFGGTVVSELGDGIMALFGALWAQEGHAIRATYAALRIRDAPGLRERGMSVRSGLHSGEVVVHMPADAVKTGLKAYGMTLHLASRLPGQVEPQEICFTDATRVLLLEAYDFTPIGTRML